MRPHAGSGYVHGITNKIKTAMKTHATTQTAHTRASDLIRRSWQRCHEDYGLDRKASGSFSDASRRPSSSAENLLPISQPELQRLTQVVGKTGHSIILTDSHGTVLSTQTHRAFQTDFEAAGLVAGQCWSEAFRGTNGIGTCLAEQSPTLVHGDQHFVTAHQNLSCAAAPIFDQHHRLLAVLDTSTLNPSRDPTRALHTLTMVSQAAKRIERAWFMDAHKGQWQLEIQNPTYGVLLYALDEQQRVVALNVQGHKASCTSQDWVGQSLDRCLDAPTLESLWDTADSQLEFQIPIFSQGEFLGFGHLVPPTQAPVDSILPTLCHTADELDRLEQGDPKMQRVIKQARRLIDRTIPVLISGETGVGKDRFAKAMHAVSERAAGPMVTVNCAAIAPDLLEAELFGYVPGAFTGANPNGHKGFFQQAHGGTLFLDEIGDMPMAAQAKLLRAVEDKSVTPVGSSVSQDVDIAIISASHVNLDQAVSRGEFRQDLLYRLRGIELALPPLRWRADKAAVLRSIVNEHNTTNIDITPEAWQALVEYPWPGNCREAVQVISTSLALAEPGLPLLASQWWGLRAPQPPASPQQFKAQQCQEALAVCNGNSSAAAQYLGISRATFYRWRSDH